MQNKYIVKQEFEEILKLRKDFYHITLKNRQGILTDDTRKNAFKLLQTKTHNLADVLSFDPVPSERVKNSTHEVPSVSEDPALNLILRIRKEYSKQFKVWKKDFTEKVPYPSKIALQLHTVCFIFTNWILGTALLEKCTLSKWSPNDFVDAFTEEFKKEKYKERIA